MIKKYESAERTHDQLNALYDISEALYQAQISIAMLDRRLYNWGQYVNIDHDTLKTINTTLQAYKMVIRGVIDSAD